MNATFKHGMKISLGCVAMFLSTTGYLKADDVKPFVDLNFDDNVPGMNCENPKRSWGTQNSDLLLIDNVNTYNGQGNAMLLEREKKNGQWGVGMNLPQESYDWLKIQIAFQFEGAATKANASLELREHYNKRLYFASLGSGRGKDPITLVDGGTGWNTASVNHFDRKAWNRVTWLIPSTSANDITMYVKLETWNAKDKQWQQVDKIGSMAASKMTKPFAAFRVNFPASEDALKLRFDDLKVEPVSNDQLSEWIK
jgi:hypothetical protein